MEFNERKHLTKLEPTIIQAQDCYQPIYNQGRYVTSIKFKPGATYTNPDKEIKARRNRVIKHLNN